MKKEEHRKEWNERINQWLKSGKSGAEWCREFQLSYYSFNYWKKRFFQKKNSHSEKPAFLELSEPCLKDTGIELQYKKISVKLQKNFDPASLYKIIMLFRGI